MKRNRRARPRRRPSLLRRVSFDAARRDFLAASGSAVGTIMSLPLLGGCSELKREEATDILVAEQLDVRVVARSGEYPMETASCEWHPSPDGGATFSTDDGGWVYVSNSESARGGCRALRFDANATVVDAYPILQDTRENCSGGATPWGTWLSCEEIDDGGVWECDPLGRFPAVLRPALGIFKHEAACVDPVTGQIYMTEDHPDGCFYRFTPRFVSAAGTPDLASGTLEVASLSDGYVTWLEVPDPGAESEPTRYQLTESRAFNGGEGIFFRSHEVFFTTKGDNRIWAYNVLKQSLRVHYDARVVMADVDGIIATGNGDLLVAEDGIGMRIMLLPRRGGAPLWLAEIPDHFDSEITGLAFDPSETRLYFSSQRGNTGRDEHGVTFEISGDFSSLQSTTVLTHREVS